MKQHLLLAVLLLATGPVYQCYAQYTRLVIEGDSLFSSNNGLSNWTDYFDLGTAIINRAQGGDLLSNIISEFPIQDAGLAITGSAFVLEGGTGDLGAGSTPDTNFVSATGAQLYSNALVIIGLAHQAGFNQCFLTTVAPSSSISTPAKEQERNNYNTLVRNGTTNGYAVVDAAAWIGETNDLRYYQDDGIHWSEDFEKWIGRTTIPDALGYAAVPVTVNISNTVSTATINWNAREYGNSTVLVSDGFSGPWTNATEIASYQNEALSFSTNKMGPDLFFRVANVHVDFTTFYSLPH